MPLVKKIRFFFRLFLAITKKYLFFVFAGFLLAGLIIYYSNQILPLFKISGSKTIKIGVVGQFTPVDLPQKILDKISFGLTYVDEQENVKPELAESWDVLNQGKTYIFKFIPEKYTWHDGKPLELSDINYNFRDVAESRSDNTITYELKEPFSVFPSVVSKPVFRQGLIGLGDYKINNIALKGSTVSSLSLTAFNNKSLPPIIYKFYPTEENLIKGFNLGETNQIDNVNNINSISIGKQIKIKKKISYNFFNALYFNTEKPEFSEKNFRQALAYATPRDNGEGDRAYSSYNPKSWAYNPNVKPYNFDINRAEELLEENESEMREISISCFPVNETLAQEIAKSWNEVGVKTRVQVTNTLPDDYDILLVTREIPNDPDQYYFWHSTQPGNLSKFKSPRLDKFLEDGRVTIDKQERKNIYLDFQRYLLEESPAVFLNHPASYNVTRG